MARFVGLADPPRIWGYLQHGWNMHDGFAVGTVFAPNYPKFVWSQACARRGWAAGLRRYKVVGSPWMYLLDLEGQQAWEAARPERRGTIVYPFHGWEGQQVLGSHTAYVEQVKQVEGDVPITVCLHWNEFNNDKVRAQYEQAGVRVITHGERGYLWKDTDIGFLYKQLDEIRAHARVVSNRMTSAILYAATAGAEVGVYGDPMALESDHAILGGVGKPRRLWPRMHAEAVPLDYARLVAEEELGAAEMLHPLELTQTFGWQTELPNGPQPAGPRPEIEIDRRIKTGRPAQGFETTRLGNLRGQEVEAFGVRSGEGEGSERQEPEVRGGEEDRPTQQRSSEGSDQVPAHGSAAFDVTREGPPLDQPEVVGSETAGRAD
jgi:hypothetical protein